MKQVKPEVVGYRYVEINGNQCRGSMMMTRTDLYNISRQDKSAYGVKSKFRPVYKTNSDLIK